MARGCVPSGDGECVCVWACVYLGVCACFPAAAHFAAESNIAVNAKGPLSNCLLLIMMMRVPVFRRGGYYPLLFECGMQISGSGCGFGSESGSGVFNVIYCVLLGANGLWPSEKLRP